MGMRWAQENLPDDFIYSTVDDDFLVDIVGFQHSVETGETLMKQGYWPVFPLICGYLRSGTEKPHRHVSSKWYIPETLYRWNYWPRYCRGGLYSTSVKTVKDFLAIAYESLSTMLYLDDVWITGVLRLKFGMPESMVVAPERPTGRHMVGFQGKNLTELINTDWKAMVDSYQGDTLCYCNNR